MDVCERWGHRGGHREDVWTGVPPPVSWPAAHRMGHYLPTPSAYFWPVDVFNPADVHQPPAGRRQRSDKTPNVSSKVYNWGRIERMRVNLCFKWRKVSSGGEVFKRNLQERYYSFSSTVKDWSGNLTDPLERRRKPSLQFTLMLFILLTSLLRPLLLSSILPYSFYNPPSSTVVSPPSLPPAHPTWTSFVSPQLKDSSSFQLTVYKANFLSVTLTTGLAPTRHRSR